MAVLARRMLPGDPATAWRVLSDITAWPAWVDSIDGVTAEGEAYRVGQPPLPSALWALTWWDEGTCWEWESRAAATLARERYTLIPTHHGTRASIDVVWSGRTAWFARAAFGPVRGRYAVAHLDALGRLIS